MVPVRGIRSTVPAELGTTALPEDPPRLEMAERPDAWADSVIEPKTNTAVKANLVGRLFQGPYEPQHRTVRPRLAKGHGTAVRYVRTTPPEVLRERPANELGKLADQLLTPHWLPAGTNKTVSAISAKAFLTLFRQYDGHPGLQDRLLAYMRVRPELRLPRKQLVEFIRMRAKTSAIRGDWDGYRTYLEELFDTTFVSGNRVEPILDGRIANARHLDGIASSERIAHNATFALLDDATGRAYVEAHDVAVQNGADSRLYVDKEGSSATEGRPTGKALFNAIVRGGTRLYLRRSGLLANALNHCKISVTDEGEPWTEDAHPAVARIGGRNLADPYVAEWHDLTAEVKGPVVADIENRGFRHLWQRDTRDPNAFDGAPELTRENQPRHPENVDALFGIHEARQDRLILYARMRAIDTAKDHFSLEFPYVGPEILERVMAAAEAGVKGMLILPHDNNHGMVQQAARSLYADYVRARLAGGEFYGRPLTHVKAEEYDNKLAVVESANDDTRSHFNNDEDALFMLNDEVASWVDEHLFQHDAQYCVPFEAFSPTKLEAMKQRAAAKLFPLL